MFNFRLYKATRNTSQAHLSTEIKNQNGVHESEKRTTYTR
jgi:hypothetical protein